MYLHYYCILHNVYPLLNKPSSYRIKHIGSKDGLYKTSYSGRDVMNTHLKKLQTLLIRNIDEYTSKETANTSHQKH